MWKATYLPRAEQGAPGMPTRSEGVSPHTFLKYRRKTREPKTHIFPSLAMLLLAGQARKL